MLFSEITPFIRYARYENLNQNFHFHESVPVDARLFYTVNGYGTIKVNGKEYAMMPYSLLLINSGIPYDYVTPKEAVSYLVLNFDWIQHASLHRLPISPVHREKFKEEMLLAPVIFDDEKALSEVFYVQEIPEIHQRLSEIVRECTQKLLYYENKAGHLLAECVAESLRQAAIGGANRDSERAKAILKYLHEHFHSPLTNISLGERFSYHPNYVSYLIKKATGMSLHQYVLHLRMMRAVNLLENTALSVGEISMQCGFCDLAYFSQYFKKYFGISPSKYRDA